MATSLELQARPRFAEVEQRTLQIGREILSDARQPTSSLFSPRFWSDQFLSWAMNDPALKVQLFRFVDVFPTLKTSEQAYQCLVEYLGQPDVELAPWVEYGLKAGGLAKGLLARTIAGRITALAGNFIAGADASTALPKLERLWNQGIAFTLDVLGEACVSDEEALAYQKRYLDLIQTLAQRTRRWSADPRLESDPWGPVPRANVSIKISALSARTDAIDFEGSLRRLISAIAPILEAASRHRVFVNFDMEQYALKELTVELFCRACEQYDFPAGLALQAYLRESPADAQRLIDWARRKGRQVTVRLIKGAYWDYEVIHADEMGWPVPVWTEKRRTDAAYEWMTEQFLAAMPRRPDEGGVKLALGTHNVRSLAHALALLEKYDLPPSAIEVQMLCGMADQLKASVLNRGLRLRQYVPLGEMIPGMAYLVRRLLENTSNQSWLRAGFFENASDDQLLAAPAPADPSLPSPSQAGPTVRGHTALPPEADTAGKLERGGVADAESERVLSFDRHQLSPAVAGLGDGRPFANEPHRDFSSKDQRERFAEALGSAEIPAVDRQATGEDAAAAVARASAAFPAWRDMPARDRSGILLAGAAALREARDRLAGIMIREAGKTWREADADVCEAIDFAEYYARSAVELFDPRRLGRFVGELNEVWHQARGVAAVISPWNFPLAITAGMSLAALATGNTVVLKPASATPGIARAFCEALWAAGVPAGALEFLPGSGAIGAALVRDPRVALIAFTGSKEVGLDILQAAGQMGPGQGFVKKVVCEMGGKNAIVVDDTADLDEAVVGVRQSAFGYSGQKCSACSRVIVLDGVYDVFLRRLTESTRSLVIGDPMEPDTDVGPVIDANAAGKIRQYIEIGKQEGALELACEPPAGLEQRVGKPYIGPHIFSGIQPHHRLATEEIFGPVLSVMRVADFRQAIEWCNATSYRLTGGVFSRTPSHLQLARREFRVGNLYLNRSITGALVGRQPFGGFGLSGTGTQAGGGEYLLHFVEPRSVCENTMRHGFAPGLE